MKYKVGKMTESKVPVPRSAPALNMMMTQYLFRRKQSGEAEAAGVKPPLSVKHFIGD
jgi:hypothetical protein